MREAILAAVTTLFLHIPSAALDLKPCRISGIAARCGAFEVPENRAKAGGRVLQLNLILLPARAKARSAVFVLHGGPGAPATDLAGPFSEGLEAARANQDLVFVDQRGSGHLNGLRCTAFSEPDDQRLFPPDKVRACRDELLLRADLTQYNTANSVEDLDALRLALGYEKIKLYGLSYGTRLAQAYLAMHAERVDGVVLVAAAPLNFSIFNGLSEGIDSSLNRVFVHCRDDADCKGRFPQLASDFEALRRRLSEEPGSGFDARALELGILFELYDSSKALRLPGLIHRAQLGMVAPLAATFHSARRDLFQQISVGLHLSIQCSEDLPFAGPEKGTGIAATLRDEYSICNEWPLADFPLGLRNPRQSSVPALIVVGEFDPVTPPACARQVAAAFRKGRVLVVPGGGHFVSDAQGCTARAIDSFLANGSISPEVVRCIETLGSADSRSH